jgi:hypothetical protein
MNSLQNNKITPPVTIKEGEESKWASSPPPIASFLQPILSQTQTQNSQAPPQPSPNSGGRMTTRAKSNTVTFAPSTTTSPSSSSVSRSAIGNGGRQKAFSDCTEADYDPAEHGGDGSVRSSRVDAKFHSGDSVNSTAGSFDSYGGGGGGGGGNETNSGTVRSKRLHTKYGGHVVIDVDDPVGSPPPLPFGLGMNMDLNPLGLFQSDSPPRPNPFMASPRNGPSEEDEESKTNGSLPFHLEE